MTHVGEQLCYRTPTPAPSRRASRPSRVGDGAARRPRPDRLLPGRRRPAVRPRPPPARRRRPDLDGPGARKVGGEIVHELEPGPTASRRPSAIACTVDLDWARRSR